MKRLSFAVTTSRRFACSNTDIPRIRTVLKHIDIHNAWARQEVQAGTFEVQYLQTDKMPADGLTKPLTRAKFSEFIRLMRMGESPVSPSPAASSFEDNEGTDSALTSQQKLDIAEQLHL